MGLPGGHQVIGSRGRTRCSYPEERFEAGVVPASIPWSESACAAVRNQHETEFANRLSAELLFHALTTREARQVGDGVAPGKTHALLGTQGRVAGQSLVS